MRLTFIQSIGKKIISKSTSSSLLLLNLSIILFIFSLTVLLTSRTIADADLWGHLRFGLNILESGNIAQADPYSYLSTSQYWTKHEWLSEILFRRIAQFNSDHIESHTTPNHLTSYELFFFISTTICFC